MSQGEGASQQHHEGEEPMTKAQRKRERQRKEGPPRKPRDDSDGDAPTNRTKPTEEGGSERPRMPSHARLTRQVTDLPLSRQKCGSWWVF